MPLNSEEVRFNFAEPVVRDYLIRLAIIAGMEQTATTEDIITNIDDMMIDFFRDLEAVLKRNFFGRSLNGSINPNQVAGVMDNLAIFINTKVITKDFQPLSAYNQAAVTCCTRQLGQDEIDYLFNMGGSLEVIGSMQRFRLTEGQVSIGLYRSKQSPYQYQLVWKLLAN